MSVGMCMRDVPCTRLCKQPALFCPMKQQQDEKRVWEMTQNSGAEYRVEERSLGLQRHNATEGSREINEENSIETEKQNKMLFVMTPHLPPWVGAAKLCDLHNSNGRSMEKRPFVRNCQRRQGPQAWSPPCQKCLFGVPLGHDRASRTGARG